MIPDVQLSKREKEVLKLVLKGKSNKQVALSLGISVRTVEFHLKISTPNFHVSSRIELILNLGNAASNALMEKLGDSTVQKAGKTPKIETGSIRKWIGQHLEVPPL
jgi:DNA-binding CsgD family transcriptional regulator